MVKKFVMEFEEEHLKEGAVCPFCGSGDVNGDSVDIVGSSAMQDCACSSCGKKWRDEYVLTYVRALE